MNLAAGVTVWNQQIETPVSTVIKPMRRGRRLTGTFYVTPDSDITVAISDARVDCSG
jgi:hypothetical protein